MLLTETDLGDDWRMVSLSADFPDFDDCETADPSAVVAETDRAAFSTDLGVTISSEVILAFADDDAAAQGIADIGDRQDCIVDAFDSGAFDTETATFTGTEVEAIDLLAYGNGAAGFRVSSLATSTNPDALATEQLVVSDVIYAVVGPVGIVVIASSRGVPYHAADLEDFTALAVEKAAADLGVTVTDPRADRPEETAEPAEETAETTRAPTPPPSPDGAIQDIVPFGETGSVLGFAARVVDVVFDAEEVVLAENQFNDPAAAGRVMVIVRLEVTNIGEAPLDVYWDPSYALVGDRGIEYPNYDPSCGVIPDPLEGVIQPSQTVTGNVCMQPESDDTGLLLRVLFYDEEFNEQQAYFALQ
jgi:hypothetical protein